LWIAKTALLAQGVRHCEKLQRTGEVRWKLMYMYVSGKEERRDCRYLEVKTQEKAEAIGN